MTSIGIRPIVGGAAQSAPLDAGVEAGDRRPRACAARFGARRAAHRRPGGLRGGSRPQRSAARSPQRDRRGRPAPCGVERDQATLYAASNGNGDRAALDSSRQRSDQALDTMRERARRRHRRSRARHRGRAAAHARTRSTSSRRCARRSRARRRRRTTRSSTATPTSSARSTCWTARSCASSAPRPRRAWPTRRAPSPARSEQLSIQHAILSGAIRAGKPLPGDPAVVNAATAQLVNNYRDYQAALTPEQLAKFGNLPDTSATSRMDQLPLGHPHRAVPAGHRWPETGTRPTTRRRAEHRPHGGADQRRAVRHGRRGRPARQQPRGHQLGHPHARPARRHHDRGAGGAVADPVAAAAAQLGARRRRAAAPAGRREHARR